MKWEECAKENFEKMIEKTPAPLRGLAREKVGVRAESFAAENGREAVTEKDMVDAFFKETPGGFHGPLTVDMEAIGLDYEQYGHARP